MPPKRKINILITAKDATKKAFNSVALGLRGLGRSAREVTQTFGGFLALGTGASLAGIKQFTNQIDKLGKTAERLGITTEELSKLTFAAERTGVSGDTLATALQRLTRRISEAANGTGVAQDALRELGLDAQRLATLSLDEQFKTVAEAFTDVKNRGDQLRLAIALMDTEAAGLVNTFEGGQQYRGFR